MAAKSRTVCKYSIDWKIARCTRAPPSPPGAPRQAASYFRHQQRQSEAQLHPPRRTRIYRDTSPDDSESTSRRLRCTERIRGRIGHATKPRDNPTADHATPPSRPCYVGPSFYCSSSSRYASVAPPPISKQHPANQPQDRIIQTVRLPCLPHPNRAATNDARSSGDRASTASSAASIDSSTRSSTGPGRGIPR